VLSNSRFLAEGSAVADLFAPTGLLIGGERTPAGENRRADVGGTSMPMDYRAPASSRPTSGPLSCRSSVANAFLAQRNSSINSISPCARRRAADANEVAHAIRLRFAHRAEVPEASVGFAVPVSRKDIFNLV